MDEIIYMKISGKMVDILVQLDHSKYNGYIVNENNKNYIYVQLKKALYGTLCAALLFWRKLTAQLQEWGFTINPYDRCVANKIIDDKQCTIVWHVDDLKILHVDPNVVSNIISLINGVFGNETPGTVMRGTEHDYLGMQLNYN
jgi:hypothetical protein